LAVTGEHGVGIHVHTRKCASAHGDCLQ
jgi:hypothetical protein